MAHLTADVDRATAPGQLEGHDLAEAGGAQVLLQHGLGQALVLVQEAQVQGHAVQQVAPRARVERAPWRPGLSSCTGLVHQVCMASSWLARGPCSSMVGLHSLRPYLSCSCEAVTVQAGRCLGSSSSGGCGCDWGVAVEAGWPPPAAAGGCCRAAMSSAGVSALTPPRLLTTVLCTERRPQARIAVDLLTSRAFGALGLMDPSLVRAALSGCVAGLVKLLCTPAGQRRVVRDGAALRVTSCRSNNQQLVGSDRWQHEEHLVQHPRQSRASTHH